MGKILLISLGILFALFCTVALWCCLVVGKMSDEVSERHYAEYLKRKEKEQVPNWDNAASKVADVKTGE